MARSTRMVTASLRSSEFVRVCRGISIHGTDRARNGFTNASGPAERVLHRAGPTMRISGSTDQLTTVTSPMPSARTSSAIAAASPTRTVTRRSGGKAATTASVAATVGSSASCR